MEKELLLMLPGPVPMPERVRLAMSRQAINHRSAEFGAVYADSVRVLKTAFGTTNDLFVISGSGTAGMEAAIANVGKDKEIACLVNGKFGERLLKISQRYGKAHEIASEWGTPINLAALEEQLEKGAQVVTMVHNETSAGIRNPAQEVGKLARKHDALFIMDGVTSIGGDLVEADKWGVDIAITGSQKCLAAPAGLAAVSVSGKAWERLCKNPPYYLDLAAYKKSAAGKPMETPYTPAVPLFLALREACLMIEEEGMAARIARHQKMADAMRAAARRGGSPSFRNSTQSTGTRIPSPRSRTLTGSRTTRCGRLSRRWALSSPVARTTSRARSSALAAWVRSVHQNSSRPSGRRSMR